MVTPSTIPGRKALLALSCAGLLLASTVRAAPEPAPAPAVPALSVEDIVARNVQARGGLDAWRAVTTLSERGRLEHGQIKGPKSRHGTPSSPGVGALDQPVPYLLEFKRPHRMRLEMSLGDLKALQLFDGKQGWTVQPSARGPVVHNYTPAESAQMAAQLDPEGPLIDAAAKGTKVALEAMENVEGHPSYRLALTLADGQQRHVWVDAKTFLDVKIDGTRMIEGRLFAAQTYFYDWKAVGGLTLPHRVETAVHDVRSSTRIIVDRVLVNEPIDDAQFSLPPLSLPQAAGSAAVPAAAAPGKAP